MTSKSYELHPMGDDCILVQLGEGIDKDIHHRVQNLAKYLDEHPFPGFIEKVTSYQSVAIYFNPIIIRQHFPGSQNKSILQILDQLISEYITASENIELPPARTIEIPVLYGGEYGPDLGLVAEHNQLSEEEVIQIHNESQCLVYMIGFSPGFPYMGGLDERIHTPRRQSPRVKLPGRSVGIAGGQTGLYPQSSPGGWQIIGRTPLKMFNIDNPENPSVLQAGDNVRFVPITEAEYASLLEEEEDPLPWQ